MEENIKALIELIQQSPLYQTVKDILVRDLQSEGLTDFLKEQIKAYCLEGIEKLDKKIEETDKLLNTNPS